MIKRKKPARRSSLAREGTGELGVNEGRGFGFHGFAKLFAGFEIALHVLD
jgi:hypothetical protein